MLTEFVKDRGNEDIPITVITEDLFEEYRFYLKKARIGRCNHQPLSLLAKQVDVPCGQAKAYSL